MTSKIYTGLPGSRMPEEVKLPGWQLEPTIVVEMSQGLPKAYLKVLEERDGHSTYTICEAGSKMAHNLPGWKEDWTKKLNLVIEANVHLFIDEEYLKTVGDRETVRRVKMGYKLEDI